MASWGVAALVDEPAVLVAAFVAHHLELGAAEVHIFLDRPDAEIADLLGPMAGVSLHLAGADGWAFRNTTQRPKVHTGRQKYFASKVLAETRLDWILHCDADEFLWPGPGGSVAGRLEAVGAGVNWLSVAMAERVQLGVDPGADIFAGAFRLPWRGFGAEGRHIYPPEVCALLHGGLCGHHAGKCFARAGRGLSIGVHHGLRDYAGPNDPARGRDDVLRLLHFDGLTALHYAVKLLRRGLSLKPGTPSRHNAGRQAQISAAVAASADPQALLRLWQAVKTLDAAQAGALAARGRLQPIPHGIAKAAAQSGVAPDLSSAGFDRALIAREAALLDVLHTRFGFDPAPLAAP